MIDIIYGFFVVFSLYAGGRALLLLVTSGEYPVGMALPCGAILLTVYSTIILVLRIPFNKTSQLTFCLLSIVLWLILEIRKGSFFRLHQLIKKIYHPLLIILIPLAVILYVDAAYFPFYGFDERSIHGIKAKILMERSTVFTEEFRDESFVQDQARRPPLVPVVMGTVFVISGSDNERGAKLIFPALYLSLILLFYRIVRNRYRQYESLLCTALLGTIPCLFMWFTSGASTGYADIPLAVMFFCCFIIIAGLVQVPNSFILAGLFGAGMVLTKQEGSVLLGILLAGYLIFEKKAAVRYTAFIITAAALLTLPWWFMYPYLAHCDAVDYWNHLHDIELSRIGPIAWGLLREFFIMIFFWSLLWIFFFWSLVSNRKKIFRERFLFLTVWIFFIYLLVLILIFLVTPQEIPNQLYASITRLLQHVTPIVSLFISRSLFSDSTKLLRTFNE